MTLAKPAEVLLSAEGCNLLYGLNAISLWSGMTPAVCRARIADGTLPTFRGYLLLPRPED